MSDFEEIEDEEYEIEMMCAEDGEEEEDDDVFDVELEQNNARHIAVRGAEPHQFEPLPRRRNRDDEEEDEQVLPQNEDFYRGRKENTDW